jgi:1-deoxy-D-xylulose-5-phosphate synthase
MIEDIKSPNDIKKISLQELESLAAEIREMIIKTVSMNGGHLASNLGIVEITLALHKMFDAPKDKIIWDVGHQCYPHKLITGRYKKFHTLRQYKGISGFPKRSESAYDVLDTGHSSTSIAAALGIAKARDLKGEDYRVVAVIGDGAMTAGLALEGLNQAGYLNTDIIILLNDNRMSISMNVGALSNYTHRINKTEAYKNIRQDVNRLVNKTSEAGMKDLALKLKAHAKAIGTPGLLFEKLGINYIGPVDGHSIKALSEAIEKARSIKGPKLIHAVTEKGRGYRYAESDKPKFHGICSFNIKNGEKLSKEDIPTYTSVFGDTLVQLAEADQKIVAITAAMPDGTGLTKFKKCYPDRFFDVGIAEQFAVTFAAGLALDGFKPVVAIYSTFLQRAYDQVIHDVCLQNLPIVFALDRAGIVGDDGPTHHGVFDLSYLQAIPNMVVMAPKDENEMQDMLKTALDYNRGPIAIRYPRGKAVGVHLKKSLDGIPIGKYEIIHQGETAVVLAVGSMVVPAMQAADQLMKKGVDITVVNARFIKPLDTRLLNKLVKRHRIFITIEENALTGGFGSSVLKYFSDKNNIPAVRCIGLPDDFIEHGSTCLLKENLGLTPSHIAAQIESLIQYVSTRDNRHKVKMNHEIHIM